MKFRCLRSLIEVEGWFSALHISSIFFYFSELLSACALFGDINIAPYVSRLKLFWNRHLRRKFIFANYLFVVCNVVSVSLDRKTHALRWWKLVQCRYLRIINNQCWRMVSCTTFLIHFFLFLGTFLGVRYVLWHKYCALGFSPKSFFKQAPKAKIYFRELFIRRKRCFSFIE